MIRINAAIAIDEREIEESFLRSPGPGGQNVNKLETAVQLRFDVRHSPSLPEPVRRRLELLAGQRLTKEGVLILTARSHRTRERNRAEALEKLVGADPEGRGGPAPAPADAADQGLEGAPPADEGAPLAQQAAAPDAARGLGG